MRDQVSWFSLVVTKPGVAEKLSDLYIKEHPDEYDEEGNPIEPDQKKKVEKSQFEPTAGPSHPLAKKL